MRRFRDGTSDAITQSSTKRASVDESGCVSFLMSSVLRSSLNVGRYGACKRCQARLEYRQFDVYLTHHIVMYGTGRCRGHSLFVQQRREATTHKFRDIYRHIHIRPRSEVETPELGIPCHQSRKKVDGIHQRVENLTLTWLRPARQWYGDVRSNLRNLISQIRQHEILHAGVQFRLIGGLV
jgi:hypothetical protein